MSKVLVALVLVGLIVIAPSIKYFAGKSDAKVVEVSYAKELPIVPSILASGIMTYGAQVEIVSELLSRVDKVLVKEGDYVTKGQKLVLLDTASYYFDIKKLEAATKQAELRLESARISLEQTDDILESRVNLLRRGYIKQDDYDDMVVKQAIAHTRFLTETEALSQSKAELEQREEQLSKHQISSPIDGLITKLSIEPGEIAIPSASSLQGSVLMTVSDTSSKYSEIKVDEADIGRVNIGQAVHVTPVTFSDEIMRGEVERISLTASTDPGRSSSFKVRVKLEDNDLNFYQGMSCRAEIQLTSEDDEPNLTVPIQAVLSTGDNETGIESAVYLYENGVSARKVVKIGLADDTNIEVLEGIDENDRIIIGPPKTLRRLQDGEAIEISGDSAIVVNTVNDSRG